MDHLSEVGAREQREGSGLSNALSELEVLLSPASEHRVEEEQREQISRDEVGIATRVPQLGLPPF